MIEVTRSLAFPSLDFAEFPAQVAQAGGEEALEPGDEDGGGDGEVRVRHQDLVEVYHADGDEPVGSNYRSDVLGVGRVLRGFAGAGRHGFGRAWMGQEREKVACAGLFGGVETGDGGVGRQVSMKRAYVGRQCWAQVFVCVRRRAGVCCLAVVFKC